MTSVSLVCKAWADASTNAFAELMIASVGCTKDGDIDNEYDDDNSVVLDDNDVESEPEPQNSIARSMQRSWDYLLSRFPYASFLSEGAFKRVYKVKNAAMKAPEAISIMYEIGSMALFARLSNQSIELPILTYSLCS